MSSHDNPGGPDDLRRLRTGMIVGAWALVLGLLTLFFHARLEEQRNPNRAVSSAFAVDGAVEVTLQRNRFGHYHASGRIDGGEVEFLLDTGATDISIPARVADRLGLKRGRPQQYRTANGTITAYATTLRRVELGDIVLEGVRASINPAMRDPQVLLGMSFLQQLDFSQEGDTLTLRQRSL